jgi:hypothetical protein
MVSQLLEQCEMGKLKRLQKQIERFDLQFKKTRCEATVLCVMKGWHCSSTKASKPLDCIKVSSRL